MDNHLTRRNFLRTMSAGAAGLGITAGVAASPRSSSSTGEKLAILGGKPVRTGPFPAWPIVRENDERGWIEVLHSSEWCRAGDGHFATQFEAKWAENVRKAGVDPDAAMKELKEALAKYQAAY